MYSIIRPSFIQPDRATLSLWRTIHRMKLINKTKAVMVAHIVRASN